MASNQAIDKRQLLKRIVKKTKISQDQAIAALDCIFEESIFWTNSGKVQEVKVSRDKVVELRTPGALQSVELVKEKAVVTKETIETAKAVEVIKEVPVTVIKEKLSKR